MLRTVKVTGRSAAYDSIRALYMRSFPANERGSLMKLVSDSSGYSEVIAFYEDETFCGFVCLLTCRGITHIIYFAVDESLRGKGYGSEILAHIRKTKPQNRIIADIEAENDTAANNEQRCRRKRFYIKNGFKVSGVAYGWRRESYEIMICGGELSANEFKDFWKHVGSTNKNFSKF